MNRFALALLLTAACDPGLTGGSSAPAGMTATQAPPLQPPTGTGATPTSGTPSACEGFGMFTPSTEPAVMEGPLVAVAPTTTIVSGPAGEIINYGSASGDFDGDGDADLAIATTLGVEIWLSPLPAGTLEVGGGQVVVTVPEGTWIHTAGDLDGDGRAELSVGPWLVSVPSSGIVSAESVAVATMVPEIEVLITDADGDGSGDLIATQDEGARGLVRIEYGPLAGDVDLSTPPLPGAQTAYLRTGYDEICSVLPRAVFADVNASGTPELLLTGSVFAVGCGDAIPNQLWELGDLRGQDVSLSHALASGLPEVTVIGDTDADGFPELTDGSNLYRLADLADSGASACPIATVPSEVGTFVTGTYFRTNDFLDISGDGKAEVLVNTTDSAGRFIANRVVDGSTAIGWIDAGRQGLPAEGIGEDWKGDFDNDGIRDAAYANGETVHMYSGAVLQALWQEASR